MGLGVYDGKDVELWGYDGPMGLLVRVNKPIDSSEDSANFGSIDSNSSSTESISQHDRVPQ
jgi:hypothetical protein